MKYLILSLAFLFSAAQLSGQKIWGKADPEQFTIRQCSFDTSANAIILIDSCSYDIEFDEKGYYVVYNYYRRIQILNKDGFSHATILIPYYDPKSYYKPISSLEAQTLNLDETKKVQITKVKDKTIFDEKIIAGVSTKKFAFPDVKEGSILEYRYALETHGNVSLPDWAFQRDLPIVTSALTTQVPEFIHYTPLLISDRDLTVHETKEYSDLANYISYSGTKNHYQMQNIPAFKAEPFTTTMNDFIPRIRFVISGTTSMSGKTKFFTDSWDKVGSLLMRNQLLGRRLFEEGEYSKVAKKISDTCQGSFEKIEAIYNHVSQRMRFNKAYSHLSFRKLEQCYADSTGNSCEINLLLISMLRTAGFNADPVLISTRDHGKVTKVYPNEQEFNSVIALVEIDSTQILLDACNPLRPWRLIAENDLNFWGLRMSFETKADTGNLLHTKWIEIRPSGNSMISINSTMQIDSEGNVTGKARVVASDYFALLYRDREKTVKDNGLKELVKIADDVDISGKDAENEKDINEKIKLKFDFQKKNTSADNDMLYVSPFLIKFFTDNPFRLNERTYPVNFVHPYQKNITTTITIPDGYKIAELPKSMSIILSDTSVRFTFRVVADETSIQLSSVLKINYAEYSPEVYTDLKALFAKMIDACNSTVVFEKKTQ